MFNLFLFSIAVLWTGEVWEFLTFTERYPGIISNILLFGFTSALGQVGLFCVDNRTSLSYTHMLMIRLNY